MRKSVLIYNLAPYRSRSNIPKKSPFSIPFLEKFIPIFSLQKSTFNRDGDWKAWLQKRGKRFLWGGACGCCSDSWRLLSPLRQIGSDLLSSVFAQNCGRGEYSGYCPVGFAQPGVRPGERGPGGADCGLEAGPDCHCGRYG